MTRNVFLAHARTVSVMPGPIRWHTDTTYFMNEQLTPLGTRLLQLLETQEAHRQYRKNEQQQDMFHVPNTGHIVSSLYEQLRNASEYTEEHLLLQRAIRRFFTRTISFIDTTSPKSLAEELIIELTLAEYISNDSIATDKVAQINELIASLFTAYWRITAQPNPPRQEVAKQWVLDLLAVRTEQILYPSITMISFLNFAFAYYSQHITVAKHIQPHEHIDETSYDTMLYIGIHKALLKSDPAIIRSMLLDLHGTSAESADQMIAINSAFDTLIALKTTDRIVRIINRNGAQLRILRQTFFSTNSTAKASILSNRKQVGTIVRQTIEDQYRDTKNTLQRGIIRSIIFLLLTKAFIGLAIEIPYDLAVYNHIAWIPLVINLFFPALFIAFTTLTLAMPGEANTAKIVQTIDAMLYQDEKPANAALLRTFERARHSRAFTITYAILFIAVIGAVVHGLLLLDFNVVQILIFIIFLSTAAFLGYRLSLQVKELEMVSSEASILSLLRDFLYTPFIFIGHQISYRYAKINLVARLLDNAIELPLKTTLRLVRQWTNFLSNKKDEIL